MVGFLLRALSVCVGLWLATQVFPGLTFDATHTLIAAALLLGIVNAVVRPLVLILTLPITFLTLGLFLLLINAGMLALVALILDGFRIDDVWTAVGASLLVSITSIVASGLIGKSGRVEVYSKTRRRGHED